MKKVIFLALIGLAACQTEPTLESKKAELAEVHAEVKALQEQIATLEEDIAKLDTTSRLAEPKKLTPVRITEVQPRAFEHFIEVSGAVISKQNLLLSSEGNGRVMDILVKEGDQVKAGQVLVRLESDLIRNQLQEAEAGFKLAKTTYERRARLWKDSIGSEIEYLNAETNYKAAQNRLGQARAQYENTMIKAPVAGRVDNIAIREGEFVGVGTPALRIVDRSELKVETEISERYLQSVSVGQEVEVSIPTLQLQQKESILFTSQYINPENRSFTLKTSLKNTHPALKPNVLAEIKFRDYQNDSAYVVPAMAIQRDLKGSYVYLATAAEGQTQAQKRYLELGRSFEDETEVLSGLEPGDRVITVGYNEVSQGQEIEIQ